MSVAVLAHRCWCEPGVGNHRWPAGEGDQVIGCNRQSCDNQMSGRGACIRGEDLLCDRLRMVYSAQLQSPKQSCMTQHQRLPRLLHKLGKKSKDSTPGAGKCLVAQLALLSRFVTVLACEHVEKAVTRCQYPLHGHHQSGFANKRLTPLISMWCRVEPRPEGGTAFVDAAVHRLPDLIIFTLFPIPILELQFPPNVF